MEVGISAAIEATAWRQSPKGGQDRGGRARCEGEAWVRGIPEVMVGHRRNRIGWVPGAASKHSE